MPLVSIFLAHFATRKQRLVLAPLLRVDGRAAKERVVPVENDHLATSGRWWFIMVRQVLFPDVFGNGSTWLNMDQHGFMMRLVMFMLSVAKTG